MNQKSHLILKAILFLNAFPSGETWGLPIERPPLKIKNYRTQSRLTMTDCIQEKLVRQIFFLNPKKQIF